MNSKQLPDIVIRDLTSYEEFEMCVELQKITWGYEFNEVVPPAIFKISVEMGGIAAGAFDASGAMLGFVYGITGSRDGRMEHWSHMVAVIPEFRGAGTGLKLKAHQREQLLAQGITVAYWTFDPLMAVNANFNFNLLGAGIDSFVPDMYGEDSGSDLHSGLGTDRFVVRWDMDCERVAHTLEHPIRHDPEVFRDLEIVNPDAVLPKNIPKEPGIRIQILLDIQSIKKSNPEEAQRWRKSVREAFMATLPKGYRILFFYRDETHGYYVLEHKESRK